MALEPGDVICGGLRIEAELAGFGAGVFGPTFVAHDEERDSRLWLTLLDGPFFPTSVDISQFMAVANGFSSLRHPALVRVALVDREESFCVVGCEALPDARTLADVLVSGIGPPTEADVRRCAIAMARGLAFLHKRSLLHGLLSPRTVLVWEDAHVLWQYGLAGLCDPSVLVRRCRRQTGEIFAPELLRAEPITAAVDVYGWASIVAQLATLADPLEAVHAMMDGVGDILLAPELASVVRAALDPSVDRRPRDGVHLLSMLQSADATTSGARFSVGGHDSQEISSDDLDLFVDSGSPGIMELGATELVAEPPTPPPQTPRSSIGGPLRRRLPSTVPEPPPPPGAASSRVREPSRAEPPAGRRLATGTKPPGAEPEPDLLELADPTPVFLESFAEPPSGPPNDAEGVLDSSTPTPPADAVAIASPRAPVRSFRPLRSPGPHGPPASFMTTVIVIAAALVPGLALLHVAGERGGFPRLWTKTGTAAVDLSSPMSVDDPTPKPATPPDAPTARDDSTKPVAEHRRRASSARVAADCPVGMARVTDRLCVDTGEFPGVGRLPRVDVTLREAMELCEARDVRLCARKDWQRACGGSNEAEFPYGASFVDERCNTASIAGFEQEIVSSGAYQGCVSGSGVYDLVGNVGEWVAEGWAMGGDAMTPGPAATCAAIGHPPPGFAGPHVGFRCCADLQVGP